MSDYLTSTELSELVGCKPNQRARMIRWLERSGWAFVVDCNGIPKVLRLYRDRRLGLSAVDEPGIANLDGRYASEPDFDALNELTKTRGARPRRGRR